MRLKLILKQSFRDFTSKSILYLTFTMFLVLAISICVGMFSFAFGFTQLFESTIGFNSPNAYLNLGKTYLPYWANEEDKSKDRNRYYKTQENIDANNPNQIGYLTEFLENFNLDLQGDSLKRFTLGLGHNQGSAKSLGKEDILNDSLLYSYFHEDTTAYLKEFNSDAKILANQLIDKYQTNNLITAYFMQKIIRDSNGDNVLGYVRDSYKSQFSLPELDPSLISWNYLKVNKSMIDKNFYDETPESLRSNISSVIKVWKQVNWSKYETQKENKQFLYVQDSFLHRFNLQIGSFLTLKIQNKGDFKDLDKNNLNQKFLIAGTISDSSNFFYERDLPIVMIPWQWMTNFYRENTNKKPQPAAYSKNLSFYLRQSDNDYEKGQKIVSDNYNVVFENLIHPDIPLETDTNWTSSMPNYTYSLTKDIFMYLAIVIGLLVLVLLGIVFYFITQQVVMMQRRTLFFLKSLGVYDSGLSFLTTAALLVPIILGILAGFFGALLIQKTMYSVALIETAFWKPYFSFNPEFFIFLFGIAFIIWGIFYLINIALIKSDKFRVAKSMGKEPASFFQTVKYHLTKNTNPKFRIGFSFVFKNIYKNLIVFLSLSICFGVILYAVQYKVAVSTLTKTYEVWNRPYKSVNLNSDLTLFSQDKTSSPYQLSYQTFNYDNIPKNNEAQEKTKPNLQSAPNQPINSAEDLKSVILTYVASLKDPNSNFNWSNYYVTQDFTKTYLNEFIDPVKGEENKEKRIKEILSLIEQITGEKPTREVEQTLRNIINKITKSYKSLNEQYQYKDGFSLYFGEMPLPANTRKVFALKSNLIKKNKTVTMQAFAPKDPDTKKYFGFENLNTKNDFLTSGEWHGEEATFLKVNISLRLASSTHLNVGDILQADLQGLNTARKDSLALIKINQIVKDETINSMMYTSQEALIDYFSHPEYLPKSDQPTDKEAIAQQIAAYQKITNGWNEQTDEDQISNTVYDKNSLVPFGLQNLTLPIYRQNGQYPGQKAEDFYNDRLSQDYLNSIGNNVIIFKEVSNSLSSSMWQVDTILNEFIIILLFLALILSTILTTLILLENRPVILLFKALGYKKSSLNWYLLSGYFVASILATAMALVISYLGLKYTQGIISRYLHMNLYFIWSWEFILVALALMIGFCLLVNLSIIVFTNLQKPREAFMVL